MSTRFTKEQRQEIVREFAIRHNGNYNPALFLEEVRSQGQKHPAYDWFEWDDGSAASSYRLEQARAFARDLRITFKVEEITAPHQVRIREAPMPMVISHMDTRKQGAGYRLVDPDDPEHIVEHCRQAAKALGAWKDRYAAALAQAGVKTQAIDAIIGKLENAQPTRKAG